MNAINIFFLKIVYLFKQEVVNIKKEIKEINQNMKDTRIGLERNCRGFLQFLFSKPRDYTQSCNLSSHERRLPLSIPWMAKVNQQNQLEEDEDHSSHHSHIHPVYKTKQCFSWFICLKKWGLRPTWYVVREN